jgi:hypothetical protein
MFRYTPPPLSSRLESLKTYAAHFSKMFYQPALPPHTLRFLNSILRWRDSKTHDTPKTPDCHPLSRLYQQLSGAFSGICYFLTSRRYSHFVKTAWYITMFTTPRPWPLNSNHVTPVHVVLQTQFNVT